jgi:hypothetical protein
MALGFRGEHLWGLGVNRQCRTVQALCGIGTPYKRPAHRRSLLPAHDSEGRCNALKCVIHDAGLL